MKVAVTSTGPKLDDLIGTRPDKCSFWLFVDPATMGYEAIPNPLTSVRGPAAGKFLAQILEEYRVKFILAGDCRCKQLKDLSENGIRVLFGMTGSARETVEKFNQSPFPECCESYL
jgi:predicted Fe-Mo cluster-binding NifX family protein